MKLCTLHNYYAPVWLPETDLPATEHGGTSMFIVGHNQGTMGPQPVVHLVGHVGPVVLSGSRCDHLHHGEHPFSRKGPAMGTHLPVIRRPVGHNGLLK